jgi:Alr-MurF fusion protein
MNIDFSTWRNKFPLTDSRQVRYPDQCIFFALRGRALDGHQFVEELYQKGVRHFVVSKNIDQQNFPEAIFYQVENTLSCLQEWARWHRSQYHLPVLAITGSNGKTIIKEWLYQLLHRDFYIVKSPKSYNSQLGVALSVLQIQEEHQLGIFEAGISQKGEMSSLERMIQAKIGIFSNIGSAHDEGFDSTHEKIEEKLLLFKNCDTLIYCSDYELIDKSVARELPKIKKIAWGFSENAEYPVKKLKQSNSELDLEISYESNRFILTLPFTNTASVENALHCCFYLLQLGFSSTKIQTLIKQLQQNVSMRLEWKAGINKCMIIDDTYNNDLAGLRVALDFMEQKHYHSGAIGKTLILSDIPESGMASEVLYSTVSRWIRDYGISKFIAVGNELYQQKHLFKDCQNLHFFHHTEQLLYQLEHQLQFSHETILVKGARAFQFEKVVRQLRKRTHNTVLELDLNALLHNFNFYRKMLKPSTKIMVMVKAFAYGSSSYEVARLLQYHNVDYLGVAYVDEGLELRKKGITVPIMVMNANYDVLEQLIKFNLEPSIYSKKQLLDFIEQLKDTHNLFSNPLSVQIELDSGMHRLGFDPQEIDDIIEILNTNSHLIRPVAVFTHLAAADEQAYNDFTNQQIKIFEQFATKLEKGIGKQLIKHVLNSPGISRFSECQMDMVRLGIGLHGIDPNGFFNRDLKAVATLKTVVSQVRMVEAGSAVGYGRHSYSNDDRKIATLAIGYADGLMRASGNGQIKVLINGSLCPLVGNICMDMCFADVTDLNVADGDEAIVFGPDLPIEELANAVGTIPYELLTHISGRVPRVFFEA